MSPPPAEHLVVRLPKHRYEIDAMVWRPLQVLGRMREPPLIEWVSTEAILIGPYSNNDFMSDIDNQSFLSDLNSECTKQ